MDAVQTIRDALSGKPHADLRRMAELAGVNYFTLRKVVSGETKEPSYRLVQGVLSVLVQGGVTAAGGRDLAE